MNTNKRKNNLWRFCTRSVAIYGILTLWVQNTDIFFKGVDPQDMVSLAVISGLILYRLFCFSVVPALAVLWLAERIWKIGAPVIFRMFRRASVSSR
ncbi:MAG: hypothetical protein Q8Q08_05480 [Candidatus Omnitrophota bacterium]|nr:hypothetical protein [Candidatus Omnitrophota bacterium]MDZ4242519.1 hypothetical protein [Candidatus Omnitrophota bacterium]